MAKGEAIDVDVKAWIDPTTKKVEFSHVWGVRGKPKGNSGKIDVAQGQPPTEIKFTLCDDQTGLDLEFYKDPDDAMWVDFAPNCPNQKGDAGQITFQSSSKKVLRVEDANSGPACDLKYSLRFYGQAKDIGGVSYKPPYEYDPDLKNGGGGVGGIADYSFLSSPLTIALGVTALLALGAYLWMR